ncbi:MAG: DUF4215 domain-containing protein [Kofleriaceae bacterium]
MRREGRWRGCGLGLLVVVAGCLPGEATTRCADGTVCAAPRVCAPAGGVCVEPEQLVACEGAAAGAACQLDGVGTGQCRDGVCVVAGCGDGVVDPDEACDDGNDDDDDDCTNACRRPTCGDGAIQGDEACDDGAANGDDRACTSRCVVATCGDGLVQAGVEACDAGADNADDAACTSGCVRNVCGDGLIFAGVEPCDDGNTASGDGCRGDCRKVEACGDGALDAGEACDDGAAGLANPADGCDACRLTSWSAEALVGGSLEPTTVGLWEPSGVAVDRVGNVDIAEARTRACAASTPPPAR